MIADFCTASSPTMCTLNHFPSISASITGTLIRKCSRLAQAELVVVDEAAAIPLPVVKSLLGPYLVFLASTVNG